MPVATKTTKADAMLSGLRAAGAKGLTRGDLFDLKIANPDFLADQLRERGHSIAQEAETVEGWAGWEATTTRFTLMVDADDQRGLFEGDATDELATWHTDPVAYDEARARLTASRQ